MNLSEYFYDNEDKAHISVDYNAFRMRVKNGMDLEQALTKPSVRWHDDDYLEWLETAKQNGIHDRLYRKRVSTGWTYERAATQPVMRRGNNIWLKKAIENGIKADCYYSRVCSGWSREEASTKPVQRMKYQKWIKLAETNGINANTFRSRIYSLKMSPEEAATMPLQRTRVEFDDRDKILADMLIAGVPVSRRLKAYYVQNKQKIDELVEERRG